MQSRLFGQLCREMDAGHDTLLYHSEVRWLSRGKVLQRVFKLRREVSEFLRTDVANFFSYIAKLAYLVDVFSVLNSLNLSVQGRHPSSKLVTKSLRS